jgi:hypothetical protein
MPGQGGGRQQHLWKGRAADISREYVTVSRIDQTDLEASIHPI